MIPPPATGFYGHVNRSEYAMIYRFLKDRLCEEKTLDWAIGLDPNDNTAKAAVFQVLRSEKGSSIPDPWRSIWILVSEYLDQKPAVSTRGLGRYEISSSIEKKTPSHFRNRTIISHLTPRIELKRPRSFDNPKLGAKKSPNTVRDLLWVEFKGVAAESPKDYGFDLIEAVEELEFLTRELIRVLERTIELAEIADIDLSSPFRMGLLNRAYFVDPSDLPLGEDEPDRYALGITACVKHLNFFAVKLATTKPEVVRSLFSNWRYSSRIILQRSWCALEIKAPLYSGSILSDYLTNTPDKLFWRSSTYPEISELRAVRFSTFPDLGKQQVLDRILGGPPRGLWQEIDDEGYQNASDYLITQELKRIEVGGNELPPIALDRMLLGLTTHPELLSMSRPDYGFPRSGTARSIPLLPDDKYDALAGIQRLEELQKELSTREYAPFREETNGRDWLIAPNNLRLVIEDLLLFPKRASDFSLLWEKVFDSFLKTDDKDDIRKAKRVLSFWASQPKRLTVELTGVFSQWLERWIWVLKPKANVLKVWLAMWPRAVEMANDGYASSTVEESVSPQNSFDADRRDSYNTPVGWLVDVVINLIGLSGRKKPLRNDPIVKATMRELVESKQRARILALHRLLEWTNYFFDQDPDWTRSVLFKSLNTESRHQPGLWNSLAVKTLTGPVLAELDREICFKVADEALSRASRKSLLFSLILDSLHAQREDREPSVPTHLLQGAIRRAEDEVRAHGVATVRKYLVEFANEQSKNGIPTSSCQLFQNSVKHFLTNVWPGEQSISSPAVSQEMARLPGVVGECFSETVEVVERFLVPFDAWVMHDYSIDVSNEIEGDMGVIRTSVDVRSFLSLLDKTIGTKEESIVPHDLVKALELCKQVWPPVSSEREFKRLEMLTRRV